MLGVLRARVSLHIPSSLRRVQVHMFSIFRPRPRRRPSNDVVPDPFGPFPRTNYVLQPARTAAQVLDSEDPRHNIQYAARIASKEWARIAASESWHEVDECLFQLAVLDKFIDL